MLFGFGIDINFYHQTHALEELIQCGYLDSKDNKIDFLNEHLLDFAYKSDKVFDIIGNDVKLENYQPA